MAPCSRVGGGEGTASGLRSVSPSSSPCHVLTVSRGHVQLSPGMSMCQKHFTVWTALSPPLLTGFSNLLFKFKLYFMWLKSENTQNQKPKHKNVSRGRSQSQKITECVIQFL